MNTETIRGQASGLLDAEGRFAGRYWWHDAILRELARIRNDCGENGLDGYSAAGIAGNLKGFTRSDIERYCRQLITWGELVECEPLWDFPDLWVKLTS